MAESDVGGLFSASQSSLSDAGSRAGGAKRRKLRHYDLLAAQVLNPMGTSGIKDASLAKLWDYMKTGNKQVEFFSELCDSEEGRHRIALSRLAEVLHASCTHYKEGRWATVVKEEVYTRVTDEIDELLPHLAILNRKGDARGASSLRYGSGVAPIEVSPAAVASAGKALYRFLTRDASALRSFMALTASGGLSFVGHCHEKGARAYVASGVDEATFLRRLSMAGVADVAAPDDLSGLAP